MNMADGKVVGLPVKRWRVPNHPTKLVGLEQIAATCMTTPDEIIRWRERAGFPLWRHGGRWTTTAQAIERWARQRVAAERATRRAQQPQERQSGAETE